MSFGATKDTYKPDNVFKIVLQYDLHMQQAEVNT